MVCRAQIVIDIALKERLFAGRYWDLKGLITDRAGGQMSLYFSQSFARYHCGDNLTKNV